MCTSCSSVALPRVSVETDVPCNLGGFRKSPAQLFRKNFDCSD